MKKNWLLLLVLGMMMVSCNNTPTTLTVRNDYPTIYAFDTINGQPIVTGMTDHNALIYYGEDCIMTIQPGKAVKRLLDKSMMNKVTKHLQVDLYNTNTNAIDYPLYFDKKVKFTSDMVYTLVIDLDGARLTKELAQ